ncbi:hypothetical protein [Aurantiacibacter sp. D1-12]|uniref:hypothetical protein n=1 Tax=Aurantiacibacter sp. D1-12 TaxID=2993658 RepID=UPI00237C88B6|nr:hypothetical protein [Aurantiacibacter sp. D1-12]MDE1466413.1 hypothetical protein [Aurantiacibacter sp. D1-12]
MGIAASSALRDENAADGPAYGSLETLGGPKKLKKKPVLVLDPEELEKAHAMFHEASADLLGEEVERAPKPAMILGLAPMEDDDPDELGQSDEIEDDGDDSQPDAEAVLSLTRRKAAPVIDQSGLGLDDIDMNAKGFGDYGYADPDGPEQDDIDLENRIFPSLPIQPDLGEQDEPEAAEPVAAEEMPIPAEEELEDLPADVAPVEPQDMAPAETEISKAPEPEVSSMPSEPIEAPLPPIEALQDRIAQRYREQQDNNAAETADNQPEPDLKPLPESAEELRERHKKDWFDLDKDEVEAREIHAWRDENWSDDEVIEPPVDETPAIEEPAEETPSPSDPATNTVDIPPFEERNPPRDLSAAEEFVDEPPEEPAVEDYAPLPNVMRPQDDDDFVFVPASKRIAEHEEAPMEIEEEPVLVAEEDYAAPAPVEASVSDDSVTYTDDDSVDGCAFMRDPRSRREAIAATPKGRQSALRAKLFREAELEAQRQAARGNSIVMRFWNWLRGLFG